MTDARRKVPSLDALLRSGPGKRAAAVVGRALLKRELDRVLHDVREQAVEGVEPPPGDEILAMGVTRARAVAFGLTPVINASGVIAAHEPGEGAARADGAPRRRSDGGRIRRPRGGP